MLAAARKTRTLPQITVADSAPDCGEAEKLARFYVVLGRGKLLDLRKLEGFPVDRPGFSLRGYLQELMQKYGKPEGEICQMLAKVSGSLLSLEKLLKGEKVEMWTDLEDLALQRSEDKNLYQCLVARKGLKETERRRQYLALFRGLSSIAD